MRKIGLNFDAGILNKLPEHLDKMIWEGIQVHVELAICKETLEHVHTQG
jgi:hypothetical protein